MRYVQQNAILFDIGSAMKKVAEGATANSRQSASRRAANKVRVKAVMRAAERSGLTGDKTGRIGGRVSPALVKQAKRQTGIESDSDLIEFALASIALEDNFAQVFKESRGTVDPELKLGY